MFLLFHAPRRRLGPLRQSGTGDGRFCRMSPKNVTICKQDFGGPVGFRIAVRHPEWVRALIIQNANAYQEGIAPQSWRRSRRAPQAARATDVGCEALQPAWPVSDTHANDLNVRSRGVATCEEFP